MSTHASNTRMKSASLPRGGSRGPWATALRRLSPLGWAVLVWVQCLAVPGWAQLTGPPPGGVTTTVPGGVGGGPHAGGSSPGAQIGSPAPRFTEDLSGVLPWPPHPSWGFQTTPEGAAWKILGPAAGDPLLEVVLPPGLSGSPNVPEVFTLQLPLQRIIQGSEPPGVIVGFHQFGVSEFAIHNGSILPDLAAAYEMILISPRGLSQVSFGNVLSQEALQRVLEFVESYFAFDRDRIYGVGFSMGGLNAYSNAQRRQDPGDYRFAGVATHMGTVDPIAEYNLTTPELQGILADDNHFGGTPEGDPFAWNRVLAGRGTPELVIDPDLAPIANLRDTRLHISVNTNDPLTGLLNQSLAMASYVGAKGWGADINVFAGLPQHAWNQFDLERAVRFIVGNDPAPIAPVAPGPIEFYADGVGVYRFTEMLEIEPNTLARYTLNLGAEGTNSWSIPATQGTRRLAIDMDALPSLSASEPMTLSHFAGDGVPITLELRNFDQAPSLVLVNGLPPLAFSFVAGTQTLRISPTDDGSFALIQIFP